MFHVSVWGAWSFVRGGLTHQNPHVATGLPVRCVTHETSFLNAVNCDWFAWCGPLLWLNYYCWMMSANFNHCKKMGAEPGRRFLKQSAAKLEPVIVVYVYWQHIFIIFFSLFVIRNFWSVVVKVGWIAPLGANLRGKGAIKPKGEIGGKLHKGGKYAQPLINRWVNFNSLALWHVSFLQILIYYDIHWSLLLNQFIR